MQSAIPDSPDSPDAPDIPDASDTPDTVASESATRFLWHRQRAVSWWLAGQADRAMASADASATARPADADYFAALRLAIECYRATGLPADNPERQLAVLSMAPVLQVFRAADAELTRVAGAGPVGDWPLRASGGRTLVNTQWAHLARLPELLVNEAAAKDGRPVGEYQVVAAIALEPGPTATMPGSVFPSPSREEGGLSRRLRPGEHEADPSPPSSLPQGVRGDHAEWPYLVPGRCYLAQPPPAPGDRVYALREWIGSGSFLWSQLASAPYRWHLLVGVLREHRVIDWWLCSGPMRADGERFVYAIASKPDAPAVLFFRPADTGPLLAEWNRLLSADPPASSDPTEP